MAEEITKETDVESKIKQLALKEAMFGFISNKFGKITIVNKLAYENMIKNNDTMLDHNGLNDVFANLSEKELNIISAYNKATPEKKESLKKEAHKVIVKKVSGLRNWMQRFLAGEIEEDKTDLEEEVLEELKKIKLGGVQVDSDILAEKDAEIEALRKKLEQATATQQAKKTTKEPEVETSTPESSPEVPLGSPTTEDVKTPEEDDPFKK